MASVALQLVHTIVADGYLSDVDSLLATLGSPSGRQPSKAARELSAILGRISAEDARVLSRAVLDAATFRFCALIDHDFKNTGLHALFQSEFGELDSRTASGMLVEAYRTQVEPFGRLASENGTAQ